jgi:hypothetical protein
MRRIVAVLAVLVISMVALVAPAFAASDSANCVGEFVSDVNVTGANLGNPGLGGQIVGSTAPGGVVGQYASSNDCPEE